MLWSFNSPFRPLQNSVTFAQGGFPFSRDDQFASVTNMSLNWFLMNAVKEDSFYFMLHL